MSEIIAINQRLLGRNELPKYFREHAGIKMLEVFSNLPTESKVPYLGLMPRQGNPLVIKTNIKQCIDISMPVYRSDFNLTWEEVTDQRALEIEKIVEESKSEVMIQWSGGIDSTCMLSAIIKNFKPYNLKRVVVACNWGSIIENPVFYEEQIKNKFKCVDINQHTRHSAKLTIGGEIADKLTISVANIDQYMGVRDHKMYSVSWRKQPQGLIDYFKSVFGSDAFAHWLFLEVSENIDSTNIPIETYFDFMWWINFNYHWISSVFLEWLHHYRHETWGQHQKKFILWYNTQNYQLWSMKNTPEQSREHGINSLRQDAKQYIFDVDKNSWYKDYKIKISSPGRKGLSSTPQVFAITNDFRTLYLESDLSEIKNLLSQVLV
jgi:hypothetical protein